MSRLPTIGGDYDSWGTVLNDYLTESAGVAVLSASSVVGATTLSLAVVPTSLAVGSYIAVDAYTTQCELRRVTNLSGSTVTVDRLLFAHAGNDAVLVVDDGWVDVKWWGLVGDATDEWAPLQRVIREATLNSHGVRGDQYVYYFQQPLAIDTSSRTDRLTVRTRTGFAPVESVGAAVMVGNGSFFFKAAASGDLFTATESDHTTPANHGLSLDIPIVFSAPYGETLPGGITSGKVYYVKSAPTASTFTVSATFQGATLDVTSDGTGYSVNNVTDGLARVYWESFRLTLTIADLTGLWAVIQQPGWTRNMRIDMEAAASTQGAATGFKLDGQISYHDNIEINTNVNCIGMSVAGSGHQIRGFNDNGINNADTGMVLGGDSNLVLGPWTEGCGRAGIEIGAGRGLRIEGPWVFVPQGAVPGLLVTSDQCNYDLGVIRSQSTATMVSDTARGITIDSYTSATVGETDISFAFFGLRQGFGAVAPELKHRWSFPIAASLTLQRSADSVFVNTSNGSHTVSLLTAVGWGGLTHIISHETGSNVCTIDPAGTETIGGASTYVVAPGHTVQIISDGANWIVVSDWTVTTSTYTPTNVTTDRSYDADTVLVAELADVVGTLIADLQSKRIVG